jgi:hypothetical protein
MEARRDHLLTLLGIRQRILDSLFRDVMTVDLEGLGRVAQEVSLFLGPRQGGTR